MYYLHTNTWQGSRPTLDVLLAHARCTEVKGIEWGAKTCRQTRGHSVGW